METVEEKSNAEVRQEYFASLDDWVKKSCQANAFFPFFLMQSYMHAAAHQPRIQQPTPVNNENNVNISALRILDEQAQANLVMSRGGYDVVIAPFWKRAIAEMIDVAIILLIKVMMTFVIVNLFDVDLGFEIDRDLLQKQLVGDDDLTGVLAASMGFFGFSSDLLMLEIFTKVMVCFYEAIWSRFYGATPGKALLNLRIQYVEALIPMQPMQQRFRVQREQMRALVYPAERPSFERSLLRAVSKNLIMTLLFPMCFIMIFFKNNRTAYDIITKTVVVEYDPNPPRRHGAQPQ